MMVVMSAPVNPDFLALEVYKSILALADNNG
jgi:hypothetical protein